MSVIRAELAHIKIETAKAIVKDQGFSWMFYIEQILEKALTETIEKANVEKQIIGGKK